MLCKYAFYFTVAIIFVFNSNCGLLNAQETQAVNPVINKIEVKGNKRISIATIKSALKIKEGDVYDARAVSQEVDAIWMLGFFSNIEIEIEPYEDGIKLIFVVSEQPIIRDIIYVGNRSIKTKNIKDVVAFKKGSYLKSHLLKLSKDKIRDLYQTKGHQFVEVKSEEKKTKGYVDIIYSINEGPKVYVQDINFANNNTFSDKRLLKIISTRKRKFPKFFFSGKFNKEKFNEDIEKLKGFYGGGGWLDVDVKWKAQYSQDKSKMFITFIIDEGKRYYVDKIIFNGNKLFTNDELSNILELKKEDAFLPEILQKDAQNIRSAYGRQGFINAVVNASHSYKQLEPKIDINYDIQENERIYIEKVIISGNDKTKDNVVRRSLLFFPGERLDSEKIRISQQILTNTGYFDNESGAPTDISFQPGSKPNTNNVVVRVKEGRTGLLRFGGGFGANVGPFADVSYSDKNFDIFDLPKDWKDFVSGNAFRGAGHVLTLRFSPGLQRTEGILSFQNPAVYDSGYSLGFSANIYRRGREDYDEERKGGKITVGKEIFRGLILRVTPNYEIIGIQNVDSNAPLTVKDLEGSNAKMSLALSVTYDRRNNRFFTTKGYKIDSNFEFSGMDVDVVKFSISGKKYKTMFSFPRWGKHVFSYGGTFGIVESTTGDSVPIFERYFAGGSGSLRGFSFRGIGPVDQGTKEQIGGKVLMLGNIEYTLPLYGEMVRGAFFVDTGKVDVDVDDINLNNLRATLGFGLRMRVPFLGNSVVSVDFGIPFISKSEDDTQAITFNFGGSGL